MNVEAWREVSGGVQILEYYWEIFATLIIKRISSNSVIFYHKHFLLSNGLHLR